MSDSEEANPLRGRWLDDEFTRHLVRESEEKAKQCTDALFDAAGQSSDPKVRHAHGKWVGAHNLHKALTTGYVKPKKHKSKNQENEDDD